MHPGQITWQQISVMTKMACGAREAKVDDNRLTFKVLSKPHHYVEVILDASDTYTVHFFRLNRSTYERITLKQSSDIYAGSLSEVIYDFVNKA